MGSDPRQQWVTIATGIMPRLGQTPIGYPEAPVPIKARKTAHVPGFAPAHAPAPPHAGRRDAENVGCLAGVLLDGVERNETASQPNALSTKASSSNRAGIRVRTREVRARDLDSTRVGAGARETGRCVLEDVLTDESIGRMAGSFITINPLLDEAWLREAIRAVHAECGSVHVEHLRRSLRATFDYCARRLPTPYGTKGHVGFPRSFATHVLTSEVKRTPPH